MLGQQGAHPIEPELARSVAAPIDHTVSRYLEVKRGQNLRPLTLKQIRWKLELLAGTFAGRQCHEIKSGMIEDWFRTRGWNRSTIDGAIAKISPFFNWCIRESYCLSNPLENIILPKKDESAPCIFTPDQVRELMRAALEHDPGMVPYLVLGIFAGIRPEEIMRLTWKDITSHGISISGHKAKTRQRRVVQIPANLASWLNLGGDLAPTNKRKRLEATRRKAVVTWGHDIMRHTFASYHLAYHNSQDKTAHELGHRNTSIALPPLPAASDQGGL